MANSKQNGSPFRSSGSSEEPLNNASNHSLEANTETDSLTVFLGVRLMVMGDEDATLAAPLCSGIGELRMSLHDWHR